MVNFKIVSKHYPMVNMTMIKKLYGHGIEDDTKQMWKYGLEIMDTNFLTKMINQS